jgi:hypothetical protein
VSALKSLGSDTGVKKEDAPRLTAKDARGALSPNCSIAGWLPFWMNWPAIVMP